MSRTSPPPPLVHRREKSRGVSQHQRGQDYSAGSPWLMKRLTFRGIRSQDDRPNPADMQMAERVGWAPLSCPNLCLDRLCNAEQVGIDTLRQNRQALSLPILFQAI